MSTTRRHYCILLLVCLLFAAFSLSFAAKASRSREQDLYSTHNGMHLEGRKMKMMMAKRRMAIGSIAPTCTYNECRACKYKCRAEQIPVDGNDPMNSPIHYKCVCHRN